MDAATVTGLASGGAIAAVGVLLAFARPRRRGAAAFAAFVIVWGAEILAFNLVEVVDSIETQDRFLLLGMGLVMTDTVLLVHFAGAFTRVRRTQARHVATAVAVFCAAVAAFLMARPELFVGPRGFTAWSSLLVAWPSFAALYITVHLLLWAHRGATGAIERRETAIVFGALAVYAAYAAGFYVILYAFPRGPHQAMDWAFLALFAAAFVYIIGLAWWARRRPTSGQMAGRAAWLAPLGLAVPLVIGVASAVPIAFGGDTVVLVGGFRIASAALVAYGLLKFHLFGIDLRVKAALQQALVAGAFLLVFFAVQEGVEEVVSRRVGTTTGWVAAGVLALAIRPLERAAGRLAGRAMPAVENTPAYRHDRALEIYRAALEEAHRDGSVTPKERRMLEALKGSLGLPAAQTSALEREMGLRA